MVCPTTKVGTFELTLSYNAQPDDSFIIATEDRYPKCAILTGKTKFLRKKLLFLKSCYYLCTAKCVLMDKITERIEAQGGTISTSELNGKAEYERLRRAVQRGEVVKLRHGVYAEPTAMLGTMMQSER